jgi:hypothetical protein
MVIFAELSASPTLSSNNVDRNIERFNVFKMNPKKDLFYAMSHGVNRAVLKKGIEDNRVEFLDKLVKKISKITSVKNHYLCLMIFIKFVQMIKIFKI